MTEAPFPTFSHDQKDNPVIVLYWSAVKQHEVFFTAHALSITDLQLPHIALLVCDDALQKGYSAEVLGMTDIADFRALMVGRNYMGIGSFGFPVYPVQMQDHYSALIDIAEEVRNCTLILDVPPPTVIDSTVYRDIKIKIKERTK